MRSFVHGYLLLQAAWGIYASGPAAFHDGFSDKWSTTECTTTLAPSPCPEVDVTVVVTDTIILSGPTITVTETSIFKSGVVLNTTISATSSALKARGYTGHDSSWGFPSAPVYLTGSEIWTYSAHCSPSTIATTATYYTTSVLAASTITKTIVQTEPASTLSCSEGCKVDVTATKLVYPRSIIHVTVPVTVDTFPGAHTPEPITWEYNGVILTYPTTYLLYTEFSHAFLATTESTLATTCPTASDSLTLPSPTNYAPLIFPQQETPGPNLPPSALISYLNGQETVLVQLSGTPIGSSCDPVGGGVVEPVPATGPAQVVYTSTYILAETTSTTETLVAVVGSTSTSTSTSSSSSTITDAATFASTGTSTVVIFSASSTSAVQVVSVADARPVFSPLAAEGLAVGFAGVILGWL